MGTSLWVKIVKPPAMDDLWWFNAMKKLVRLLTSTLFPIRIFYPSEYCCETISSGNFHSPTLLSRVRAEQAPQEPATAMEDGDVFCWDSQEGLNYTLVNIQKTMEHHQILWVINCKRSFSIAMLVYQRVHDKWLNITFRPSIYWIVELVDGFKYVLHPTNGMAVPIDNLFLPGVAQPPTRYSQVINDDGRYIYNHKYC